MIGQTISHYRIVEELGKGGMGLVYKAEDTKLNRAVAIKLLAAHMVASDTDRQRFYREARAAAALHHPNIATVFEIDETEEGHPFIVMEFIEGQPLDVGIAERPLPLEQAVAIALQIAEALKAAHEKAIVHRDIKSANVMLTTSGRAKVLDFGLAKTTASTKLTKLGSTLGTIAYMSPEQARGEEVDRRTDLWALGVVLYEMISGKLPFPGDYEQAVMYGIVNVEPEPLTGLRTGVPMALEQVVAKCLRKDRALRYQHADDLIADLQAIDRASLSGSRALVSADRLVGTAASDASHEARTQARSPFRFSLGTLIPWAIAAAALSLALIVWLAHESSDPPLPLTSSLVFEAGAGLAVGTGRNLALSPDGTQLAYVTSASFDGGRLWIRDLADGSMRPLTGTEGAERPFWSPDGSMIGYFAKQALRVVPAKGGSPISLASAPKPSGGAWNARGVILYNPTGGPLFQIPAAGGTPTQVTQLTRQGEHHRSPVFLPDGRHFLFWIIDFSKDNDDDIYKGDLETGRIERIREGGDPTYVESGFLVFRLGYDLDVASVFAHGSIQSVVR
ncbi:MAG: serine/threonine-protein kinase [Bacteroidetes bacterium]|nr:serine/threonine-protein kinase [Bacteroidota bacterium]